MKCAACSIAVCRRTHVRSVVWSIGRSWRCSEARGEAETRALIVQENRRYARRQLIWFRKEPTLIWFEGPGELPATLERVVAALATRGILEETVPDGSGH